MENARMDMVVDAYLDFWRMYVDPVIRSKLMKPDQEKLVHVHSIRISIPIFGT